MGIAGDKMQKALISITNIYGYTVLLKKCWEKDPDNMALA